MSELTTLLFLIVLLPTQMSLPKHASSISVAMVRNGTSNEGNVQVR